MTKRPLPGSPCSQCGKCCTNLYGTFEATGEDVRRWRKEGRKDILANVMLLGPRWDPWGDFIGTDGQTERCPFLHKIRGSKRYRCSIYETRPQVCRDFIPWESGICEVVNEPSAQTRTTP
jgi:Fe-S-cluster containining protein